MSLLLGHRCYVLLLRSVRRLHAFCSPEEIVHHFRWSELLQKRSPFSIHVENGKHIDPTSMAILRGSCGKKSTIFFCQAFQNNTFNGAVGKKHEHQREG